MASARYISEATAQNFEQMVIANSAKGPVLVNYWAPWAGPCLKLWPVLEKLAHEFGGRFLLVNINTDEQQTLAKAYGVNSLPTLKVFRSGQVVDQAYGAESETALRRLLERHLPRGSDADIAAAVRRYHAGEGEAALQELSRIGAQDPENPRAPLARAKLLLREQRFAEAEQTLAELPEPIRTQKEASTLLAHAMFMQALADAPTRAALEQRIAAHEGDLAARFQLAAVQLMADRYEEAICELLQILKRDRRFRDNGALRGVTAILNLLGREHPLSEKYRKQVLNLLH